jgi:hypothetical protein
MSDPNGNKLLIPLLSELADGAKITPVGLQLPEHLSVEKWQSIGRGLGQVIEATQWWIGDWWAFGEHKYGERKALVESENWSGPAFQTCANAASTCKAFKTYRRRELLSFKHHAVLASLKLQPGLVEELLDWCEAPLKNGAKKIKSVPQLQDEIVARHNDFVFKEAIKSIDECLARYGDIDRKEADKARAAISTKLLNVLKLHQIDKVSIRELELEKIIVDGLDEIFGSESGDTKQLIEFMGPVRRLAQHEEWDWDEMVKAQPPSLLKDDIRDCTRLVKMVHEFLDALKQGVSK